MTIVHIVAIMPLPFLIPMCSQNAVLKTGGTQRSICHTKCAIIHMLCRVPLFLRAHNSSCLNTMFLFFSLLLLFIFLFTTYNIHMIHIRIIIQNSWNQKSGVLFCSFYQIWRFVQSQGLLSHLHQDYHLCLVRKSSPSLFSLT